MNYLTTFALCVTIAMASAWPQTSFGGNRRPNQQFPNPTQTPVTPTTPAAASVRSPAFLRCTREQCLTTNEYNPVCASDQQVYTNIRKLECANRCGQRLIPNWQDITMVRSGACTPGGRVA